MTNHRQNLVIEIDVQSFIYRYCFFLLAILGLLLHKMLLARASPPSIRIHLWRIGVRAFAHTLITSVALLVATLVKSTARTGERWFLIIVLLVRNAAVIIPHIWNEGKRDSCSFSREFNPPCSFVRCCVLVCAVFPRQYMCCWCGTRGIVSSLTGVARPCSNRRMRRMRRKPPLRTAPHPWTLRRRTTRNT
jgi:hypothetical protein